MGGSFGSDIYVYDGTEVTQLTDTPSLIDEGHQVDGGVVVWEGHDGSDNEIFMAYKTNTGISAVPENNPLQVYGALPNPFNPVTEIVFATTQSEDISIRIFDIRGRLIADLGQRVFPAGQHGVIWNGTDSHGQAVPSGVYFYQVQSSSDRHVGKLTLVE